MLLIAGAAHFKSISRATYQKHFKSHLCYRSPGGCGPVLSGPRPTATPQTLPRADSRRFGQYGSRPAATPQTLPPVTALELSLRRSGWGVRRGLRPRAGAFGAWRGRLRRPQSIFLKLLARRSSSMPGVRVLVSGVRVLCAAFEPSLRHLSFLCGVRVWVCVAAFGRGQAPSAPGVGACGAQRRSLPGLPFKTLSKPFQNHFKTGGTARGRVSNRLRPYQNRIKDFDMVLI